MKKIIILMIAVLTLLFSCKDLVQETMKDKDFEEGKFDYSKFDKAKYGK